MTEVVWLIHNTMDGFPELPYVFLDFCFCSDPSVMEYNTSRIRLRKLSPPAPERISISSQYKNNGPIFTPRRKTRTISVKRKGTTNAPPKIVNAGPRGTGVKRLRLDLSLPQPADSEISQSELQPHISLDSVIGHDENETDWPLYNDADSPSSHLVDAGDNISVPLSPRLPPAVSPPSDDFTPGGYELFFDSVISGGLPFYQLSKKTFVANGWNTQKSEATVSFFTSFVNKHLNLSIDLLVSHTREHRGDHQNSSLPLPRFEKNVILFSLKIYP